MSQPQIVLETPWFRVETVAAGPAGKPNELYYQVNQPDGVLALTLTPEGRVVLVRQYRPPLGRFSLEVPAGAIDDDETPEDAARREIYEETGYRCGRITSVGTGRVMMGRLTCSEHMILATDATKDPAFVPKEDIDVVELDMSELREMIMSGGFEQISAIALIFMVQEKLGRKLF